MSLPYPKPINILFTIGVVVTALFLLGFLWYALWSATSTISGAVATSMNQYDVANTTYQSYELAVTFMDNLWNYLLLLIGLGIFLWVIIYSQRKSAGYQ